MVDVDKLFGDIESKLSSPNSNISVLMRSRREAQLVRAGLYYRAIKNGKWWTFNIIGGTEIMVRRGKL